MSTQTHWTVDSPQALEGMQSQHWKGEHPFFIALYSAPYCEPLWIGVPFEFVRALVLQFWLDIDLDCGSAGTGLYVCPISPWVRLSPGSVKSVAL